MPEAPSSSGEGLQTHSESCRFNHPNRGCRPQLLSPNRGCRPQLSTTSHKIQAAVPNPAPRISSSSVVTTLRRSRKVRQCRMAPFAGPYGRLNLGTFRTVQPFYLVHAPPSRFTGGSEGNKER